MREKYGDLCTTKKYYEYSRVDVMKWGRNNASKKYCGYCGKRL